MKPFRTGDRVIEQCGAWRRYGQVEDVTEKRVMVAWDGLQNAKSGEVRDLPPVDKGPSYVAPAPITLLPDHRG